MPALQDLNLDYNLIHMIKEDTWGLVASQITSLSLEGSFNTFYIFVLENKFYTNRRKIYA